MTMTREEKLLQADRSMKELAKAQIARRKAERAQETREREAYADLDGSIRAIWMWAIDNNVEFTAQLVLEQLPELVANQERRQREEETARQARALARQRRKAA